MERDPESIHETVFRCGHNRLKATVAKKVYQRSRLALVEIGIKVVHQEEGRLAPFVSEQAELSGTQGYHRGP
jgi:hypothetical protein